MISISEYGNIKIDNADLYKFAVTKKYIQYAKKLLENFDNPQIVYKEKPHPDIMQCIDNKLYWSTSKSPAYQVYNQNNIQVLDSTPECKGFIHCLIEKNDLVLYVNNLHKFESKYFKSYNFFNRSLRRRVVKMDTTLLRENTNISCTAVIGGENKMGGVRCRYVIGDINCEYLICHSLSGLNTKADTYIEANTLLHKETKISTPYFFTWNECPENIDADCVVYGYGECNARQQRISNYRKIIEYKNNGVWQKEIPEGITKIIIVNKEQVDMLPEDYTGEIFFIPRNFNKLDLSKFIFHKNVSKYPKLYGHYKFIINKKSARK